jgi:hypothetical protein
MTTRSSTVTTTSGIEVVITFACVDGRVSATGEAVPSPITEEYDASYRREERRYLAAVAAHGLAAAGDPPLDGAVRYLMEIDIVPSESPLGRPDGAVRSIGGSGTEWRVVWHWAEPVHRFPISFTIRTPTSEQRVQVDG